ncbi:MAG: hypothetical protein MUP70_17860, partial [Candidatus Aminicenantes bacterium]|nr:hypothetical protein [Candidatus Aminicenantes bacterium]
GTFSAVYPIFETQGKPGFYSHVNNDYLEFLSELGFVGFILLFAAVLLIFLQAFFIWRARRNPEVKALTLGGLSSCLVLLVHAVTDSALHIPALVLLFAALLALTLVTAGLKGTDLTEEKEKRQ